MHVVMAGDYPPDRNRIAGGVEAVTWNLTQALQGYPDLRIDLITLDRSGVAEPCVRHKNLTVHYLPAARATGYLSVLANIRRLRAEMRRLQPDVVHAQVAGEYAEAAAGAGRPWLLTLHGVRFLEVDLWQGFLNRYYRGWFIKRSERRALQQARHIISISPFIRTVFDGQLRGAIYEIANPIEDAFYKIVSQPNDGQLLFVGRLIPRKGVHTLLRAFAHLHRRLPTSQLRLAGGSGFSNELASYHADLQRFVLAAGLQDAVTFLGPLDKAALRHEYAHCSAVVLASVVETAPMVIMEAMAAGKAVVSTDAGGARYLVEEGQSGLIVPPNDEAALAEALYQVLHDPACATAMGERARVVARAAFHADVVAARTREVYYKMLGQAPPTDAVRHHQEAVGNLWGQQ